MARKSKNKKEPVPSPPSVSPSKGIELLRRQQIKGDELLISPPLTEDDYSAWKTASRNYLEMAFGMNDSNVSEVMEVGKYGSLPMRAGEDWWARHRAENLSTQLKKIESLIEVLQTHIEVANSHIQEVPSESIGEKIFLVHGHDPKVLAETARFLEKLDLDVTILHEQPNKGRTLIEKFEDYADVGFAVILLTPDDKGGPVGKSPGEYTPRARQNVILELGFFLGKIGRKRVCPLYVEGVEIPSDYSGVAFVKLDDGGAWKIELAKEIKAAEIDLDMNLIL